MRGVITAYNPASGWALVRPAWQGRKLFCHRSAFVDHDFDEMAVGEFVAFREKPRQPGEARGEAVSVRRVLTANYMNRQPRKKENDMAQGTVKTKTSRWFGFIKAANGGDALFFHATQLVGVQWDDLQQGDLVGYIEDADPRGKGPRATQVERLQRATPIGGDDGAPRRWPAPPTGAEDGDDNDGEDSDNWEATA